jgi:hypothetical protein
MVLTSGVVGMAGQERWGGKPRFWVAWFSRKRPRAFSLERRDESGSWREIARYDSREVADAALDELLAEEHAEPDDFRISEITH